MAGELLTLYAARQAVPGHAFAGDGELTRRLEDGFAYEETDDQAEAIDDVKNDMEAAHPMDRLICGDVGYGKTEVALRAALKAAEGGKQTLMLVPTTILAEQHYLTFAERFEELPVTVQMVSRFRTAAEQRRILAEFHEGKVDVLIGTHRLLSRDVVPRDLGLVIVDEEQRFGVRQKELLRQLKLQVDVVSLSATPIPRTLQMSLTGIRDISVIETPPRGRHEVRTYIGEYRDDLVRAAIEKELAREGQVFYLHNRVETIDRAAEQVRDLVPGARIAVGHGQMHERQLEKVMLGFLAGEADVLVSTSIIESGIDVPTANTLIVERADLLGLAQLYQIRGRIGRSDQYAYAYLLYPSEEYLTADAAARLRTLSDYTELGSGFKIAMRDLEIRGAGNLLGDEQSGQVAAVGFEMYAQLLEEAVADLRGEPPATLPPVRLEIPVTAYVPPDYIAYEATKIDAHRRIAQAGDPRALDEVRAELTDRFGAPPEPVDNLLALQSIRLRAAALGASAVVFRGGRLQVEGLELSDEWAAAVRAAGEHLTYFKQKRVLAAHKRDEAAPILAWVGATLDAIIGLAPDPPSSRKRTFHEETRLGRARARPGPCASRRRRLRWRQGAAGRHRHGRRGADHQGAVRSVHQPGQGQRRPERPARLPEPRHHHLQPLRRRDRQLPGRAAGRAERRRQRQAHGDRRPGAEPAPGDRGAVRRHPEDVRRRQEGRHGPGAAQDLHQELADRPEALPEDHRQRGAYRRRR